MSQIGVIEGFFGPAWPTASRESYARFLKEAGADFYIYAPKADSFLRKQWREEWPSDYLLFLKGLISVFHAEGIKFGVGFSPFGLGHELSAEDREALTLKASILNALGVDILGLFFDDMPITEKLADTQIETLKTIKQSFSRKVIFCPSYYSPDPILDEVFGQRPADYLSTIAASVASDVGMAWTGPKVISPEIDLTHLKETTALLKRKPFIWDNLFANDGPKNCKFLKITPFSGRDRSIFEGIEGLALNLMNQPELSKILFLSSVFVLKGGSHADEAFQKALATLCTPDFADFLTKNRSLFTNRGLDEISGELKLQLIDQLAGFQDAGAREIIQWLNGAYAVGSECLTD